MCVNSVHFCHLVYSMFSQKFIFIFIFEYPLRIISELIKILVDTLIEYYTDWHGVDEDQTSINKYGGCWHWGDWVGVMYRDILDAPDTTWDPTTVASRPPEMILIIYGLS